MTSYQECSIGEDLAGWKIYYGNGTVFGSAEGLWQDAPSADVQAVVVYSKKSYSRWSGDGKTWYIRPYRWVRYAFDYYLMHNGKFICTNLTRNFPEELDGIENVVKEGAWLDSKVYRDIVDIARKDYEVP